MYGSLLKCILKHVHKSMVGIAYFYKKFFVYRIQIHNFGSV